MNVPVVRTLPLILEELSPKQGHKPKQLFSGFVCCFTLSVCYYTNISIQSHFQIPVHCALYTLNSKLYIYIYTPQGEIHFLQYQELRKYPKTHCIVYSTFQHCIQFTVHCTMFALHLPLHTVHCTLYSVHWTGYTVYCSTLH